MGEERREWWWWWTVINYYSPSLGHGPKTPLSARVRVKETFLVVSRSPGSVVVSSWEQTLGLFPYLPLTSKWGTNDLRVESARRRRTQPQRYSGQILLFNTWPRHPLPLPISQVHLDRTWLLEHGGWFDTHSLAWLLLFPNQGPTDRDLQSRSSVQFCSTKKKKEGAKTDEFQTTIFLPHLVLTCN
jgi:hypothetical protein